MNCCKKEDKLMDTNTEKNDDYVQIQKQLAQLAASVAQIKNEVILIRKEVKKNIFKKIISFLFHTKIKVKNNKRIKRYCFLGISLFKKHKPIVNYRSPLGLIPYKYVHILHKNSINVDIVKMMKKNFDDTDHAFCFIGGALERIAGELFAKNVYYGNIKTLLINKDITQKIIIYGMYSQDLVHYLYNHPDLLKITYWAIQGGDLYSAPDDEINNFVRKKVKAIITTFDKSEYNKRYGKKRCLNIVYKNPVANHIIKLSPNNNGDTCKILINNCSDETTLEALDMLYKYREENIIITTILSYRTIGDNNVTLKILEKGKTLFGNKFQPILKYMQPEQYAKFLSTVDIYISNQDWQRGVGNICALMMLGKKVFVKSTVSTFSGFDKLGIKIYDTFKIKKMDFNEFIAVNKDVAEKNKLILLTRAKEEYQMNLWEKVIND